MLEPDWVWVLASSLFLACFMEKEERTRQDLLQARRVNSFMKTNRPVDGHDYRNWVDSLDFIDYLRENLLMRQGHGLGTNLLPKASDDIRKVEDLNFFVIQKVHFFMLGLLVAVHKLSAWLALDRSRRLNEAVFAMQHF